MGTIVVSVVLIVIVACIIRKLVMDKKKGKSGCGCGCAECEMNCHKPTDAARR